MTSDKESGLSAKNAIQNSASHCAEGEMGHQGVHDLSLRLLFFLGRACVHAVRL